LDNRVSVTDGEAREHMSLTEDQTATIEFLASPSTHGGMPVERIETHISIVFLAGSRAWKLKRAVRLDYIDASTPDRRRVLCEKEVALNRRTAPSLYVGVVAVTRQVDGSLALRGSGVTVDWVVEMTRFDQDALFDRLAEHGRLDIAMMAELGAAVAAFHREAEPRRDHGGRAGMRWVVDGNAAGFSEFGAGLFEPEVVARVIAETRETLERSGSLLEARREAGFVRQCHGDLHLRNIVLSGGQPLLFDGVEFNDEIACGDVLYDLAFLLMDLWRRRLATHANAVWNRYLTETCDFSGIGLMPLFLSCRAAIRAKTNATALNVQTDPARVRELQTSAREYLAMAERLLHPPTPCLVAIGGLSGSGKSALARALAPLLGAVPGAIVFRSDEIRKQMCGVPVPNRLGPEGYTGAVTRRVYETMIERAGSTVHSGFTAIVDATFLRLTNRHAIERVAHDAGFPFIGLWLEAPVQAMIDRLQTRGRDASDADAAVLRNQRTQDTGAVSWHRLDSSASVEAVREKALSFLRDHMNDAGVAPMSSVVH
jgi:aminoglycoside phosphotransferase family enzyme/predicted kinase